MQRSRPGEFTTCELTSTSPRSAVKSPAMIRINVVLPQPLGPSSETNSFLRMARKILYSATRPGLRGSFCSKKILERRRTSSIHQTCRPLAIRNPERLFSAAQFLESTVNEPPIEKLRVRHRRFEIADLFEEVHREVIRRFGNIAVDPP